MNRLMVVLPMLALTASPNFAPPPGAINPQVTQANISTTICDSGWIRTIRPQLSSASALKQRQMKERNLPGRLSDYQEDYLIQLELGGHPTDLRNIWLQPIAQAELKNQVEFGLNRAVCAYRMPLVEAQHLIRDPRNW